MGSSTVNLYFQFADMSHSDTDEGFPDDDDDDASTVVYSEEEGRVSEDVDSDASTIAYAEDGPGPDSDTSLNDSDQDLNKTFRARYSCASCPVPTTVKQALFLAPSFLAGEAQALNILFNKDGSVTTLVYCSLCENYYHKTCCNTPFEKSAIGTIALCYLEGNMDVAFMCSNCYEN